MPVNVAADGALPVLPIRTCPLVSVVAVTVLPVALVVKIDLPANEVALVPPLATVTGTINEIVPLPVIGPPVRPVPVSRVKPPADTVSQCAVVALVATKACPLVGGLAPETTTAAPLVLRAEASTVFVEPVIILLVRV